MFGNEMFQRVREGLLDPVLKMALTPELLAAWQGLGTESQMRIALLIASLVLIGAILMTSGARALLLAALIIVVVPPVADIVHQIVGADEMHVRNALYLVAVLAAAFGAVTATLVVVQRAVLVASAFLLALFVHFSSPHSVPLTSEPLASLWAWVASVLLPAIPLFRQIF